MSLHKLLCNYYSRSCISIKLIGTQNNSLCCLNGLSCRNVSRLCPVSFTLRAVVTTLTMCKLHYDDEGIVKTRGGGGGGAWHWPSRKMMVF